MSTDFDSPWKEALDAYFEAFLALLFSEVHAQIDWSRGYEQKFVAGPVAEFARIPISYIGILANSATGNGSTFTKRTASCLYEQGFSAKDVRELFRLIDWTMELPAPLEEIFCEEVETLQKETLMPYVTSIERSYQRKGFRIGIESLLRVRFGEEGLKLMPEIEQIYEVESLQTILHALETAASPEEVRRLWMPGNP